MTALTTGNTLAAGRDSARFGRPARFRILTRATAHATGADWPRAGLAVVCLSAMLWAVSARAALAAPVAGTAQDSAAAPTEKPRHAPRPAPPEKQGRGPAKRADSAQPVWDSLSEDQRKALESFTQEHFPGMYLELKRLKEKNRKRFTERMRQVAPELQRMEQTLRDDPEQGSLMIQERQLDLEIRRLAAKFAAATDEDTKPALRKQIHKLCEKAFDCRHQRRALEIRELEARLTELKARHTRAAQMREQLVAQEVKERLEPPPPPKTEEQPGPKKKEKAKEKGKVREKPKAPPEPEDQPPTP